MIVSKPPAYRTKFIFESFVAQRCFNPLSVSYFFKESVEIVLYHVKIGYFKLDISRPSILLRQQVSVSTEYFILLRQQASASNEYFNVQSTNKSLTQLSTLTFKGLR